MQTFETTIKGVDGEHLYQTTPYSFDEGMAIQLELGRIVGGVAGPVVDFASDLFTFGDEGLKMDTEGDAASFSDIGRAVSALPEGIIKAGGVAFVKRLLANTSREIDITGTGELTLTKLDQHWLDHVYPAGNWGELYKAVGWVLLVNFSPFGRDPSFSWSGLWARLTTGMSRLSSPTTETPQPKPDGSSDNT